jgi:hypothetical protein
MKWIGHRDLCALQWGEECDCNDVADPGLDEDDEAPRVTPSCDGRDCGGLPHE